MLQKPRLKAELLFVIDLADTFQKFNGFFQNCELLIHLLYEESLNLVKKLLKRILKPNVNIDQPTSKSFSSKNVDTPYKIVLNDGLKKELSRLPKDESQSFLLDMQQCYLNAARYFFEKSCLSVNKDTKHLRCLNPKNVKSIKSV